MAFVSSEPMVLIGPGSEWFWTAVSGFVLGVTFLAIWRQLRVQTSANTFAQLQAFRDQGGSEHMVWAFHDVLVAYQQGVRPDALPVAAADLLAVHWETVGNLVRSRNFDRRAVYDSMSFTVQFDWALLRHVVAKRREDVGMPEVYEHFEWLATQMARMDGVKGHEVVFDEAYIAARVPQALEWCRDRIRFFERSRVVYVREAPAAEAPAASGA